MNRIKNIHLETRVEQKMEELIKDYSPVDVYERERLIEGVKEIKKRSQDLLDALEGEGVLQWMVNIISFGTYKGAKGSIKDFLTNTIYDCDRYLNYLKTEAEGGKYKYFEKYKMGGYPRGWLSSVKDHLTFLDEEIARWNRDTTLMRALAQLERGITTILTALWNAIKTVLSLVGRLTKKTFETVTTIISILPFLIIGILAGTGFLIYKLITANPKESRELATTLLLKKIK